MSVYGKNLPPPAQLWTSAPIPPPVPDPRDATIAQLVEALGITRDIAHSMAHSKFDGVWDQSDFDDYTPDAVACVEEWFADELKEFRCRHG